MPPGDVVFTGGGTESNNLAIKGLYWARRDADPRRNRVLASSVEHHAVLDPVQWLVEHEGAEVTWLPVDGFGVVRLEVLSDLLAEFGKEVALVSVMWANNEVGSRQPIAEIAQLCSSYGIPFHSDAVQAVGQLDVDASTVSALTLSGHKVGGPHGIGALVLARDVVPVPLLHGGGQERDVRSGTLDTAAISGLAAALTAGQQSRAARIERIEGLRHDLVRRVLADVDGSVLNGHPDLRLPGVAHFSFPGCDGDALLLLLDAGGVECSTGSACSAGVPQPSHVLLAMGVDEQNARGSLRFSLGHSSEPADIDALISLLPAAVDRARRAGPVSVPSARAASASLAV